MTLVEVVVTVALVALVAVPLSLVMVFSFNASVSNASRQNAALVATNLISRLTAAPYPEVGFTSTVLAGAPASYGATASSGNYLWTSPISGSSVQLVVPSTSSAVNFTVGSGAVPFAPVMNVTLSGTTYTVDTYVYWDSATVPACPGYSSATSSESQAYKHVYVSASWHNGSLAGQLSQDTIVYPGGRGLYSGPSYNTSAASSGNQNGIPAIPGSVTATPTTTAGEITVSWTLPSGWTASPASAMTSCFAVAWSNANNVGSSSGMLSNTSGISQSGSTASYTVTGLQQGSSNQAYTFYVTAYAPNGIDSTSSTDSRIADAPQGPVISAVSDNATSQDYGASGDTVTLSGIGFATSGMQVAFCADGQSPCTGSFSTTNLTCASTTSCTWQIPTPATTSQTGVFQIIAETPTGTGGAEITSPPTTSSEFIFRPSGLSGPSSAAAGSNITVTGSYLFQDTTIWFNDPNTSVAAKAGTTVGCTVSGTTSTCTVTVPNGLSGNSAPIYAENGTVLSASSSPFKYA